MIAGQEAFLARSKTPGIGSVEVIGWREWVALPDLGISRIKVKVDTGARSSSLHAFDIEEFERENEKYVRFQIHPVQREDTVQVAAEAKVLEYRSVRSSSGKASVRPVILATVAWMGSAWEVELTLANRDQMGFRMLLGREGIRGRYLVDPGKSYYGGKPKRKKKTNP